MRPSRSQPAGVMVTPNFPLPSISGGRKRATRLLDAVQRAGVSPYVLTLEAPSESGLEEAKARNWHVEHLPPSRSTPRWKRQLRWETSPLSDRLARRLQELAISASFVQLEEIGAAHYARYVPSGTPLIVSLHNVDSRARNLSRRTGSPGLETVRANYRRFRMAGIEARSVRRATATFAVSTADVTHFRSLGGRDVVLVPNGVDNELFELPVAAHRPETVLFFGELSYRPNLEGISRFIQRSWPLVAANHPDATLRIVGPSTPSSLADLAGKTAGVELVGLVDDLATELAASALVVVPIWSGGGTRIKVLEALAAAKPLVGTSLGVEQIGFADGVHGLVADSDDGLASSVCSLLEDPGAAESYALAGRELARTYEWTRVTEPAEDLYRELTLGRGGVPLLAAELARS
jgi:glycosyltransferase involved in cell wall biosynthesis